MWYPGVGVPLSHQGYVCRAHGQVVLQADGLPMENNNEGSHLALAQ